MVNILKVECQTAIQSLSYLLQSANTEIKPQYWDFSLEKMTVIDA